MGTIRFGGDALTSLRLGDSLVSRVYYGNELVYGAFLITPTLGEGVTASSSNPTFIFGGETKNLVYYGESAVRFPATIEVTGADAVSWDVEEQRLISTLLTNITVSEDSPTGYYAGDHSQENPITLIFSGSGEYHLPAVIPQKNIVGATLVGWDPETGQLQLVGTGSDIVVILSGGLDPFGTPVISISDSSLHVSYPDTGVTKYRLYYGDGGEEEAGYAGYFDSNGNFHPEVS